MANKDKLNRQLLEASQQGDIETALALLTQGADIEARVKGNGGNTPLLLAAWQGHTELVQRLVDHGAHCDAKNSNGSTALLAASWHGYTKLVQFLLKQDVNAEVKNNDGDTPLMIAVRNGRIEIVKILLDAGVDPDIKNNYGKTALTLAEERDRTETIALLNAVIEKRQLLQAIAPKSVAPIAEQDLHF